MGWFFGSGLFSATGSGFMPSNNTDIPGSASYFFWNEIAGTWTDGGISNVRFVVAGNSGPAPIPEPGTLLLIGSGLVGLGAGAWRRKKH